MKSCPVCHREYADAQNFCLHDGTSLANVTAQSDIPTTAFNALNNETVETPTLVRESLQAIVEFRHVSFAIDGATILEDLNLQIFRGETLVLLGESGCGKTTTLKMINRLSEPTRGAVLVEGKATVDWDPIRLRRRTGYVLQEAGLFPHFTIERNVALVPDLENWSEVKTRARTTEMLELVGLPPEKFARRFPHELSGGQRQRVGVARALAANPDLLLLDEPFGALDAITRTNLQKEFAALVRNLGKTAVFVTHDLQEAFVLGTRICLMDKGRIVLLDTPENFMKSDLPLARAYLETVKL
jgi:osmoprotectant transport system ATP-binding protein